MSSLKAVIFDYGKVLSLPPTEADWHALSEATGVPLPKFFDVYWGHRDAYDRNEVTAAEYWNLVAKAGSKAPLNGHVAHLTELDNGQWTRENPAMVSLARELKSRGYKIAILSNMQVDMLAAMRRKFDWLGEFDVQMYSCESGMVKPSVEFYHKCTSALSIHPNEALFLDDKQPNIDGAEKAGLHALLFHGERSEAESKLAQLDVKL